MDIGKLHGNDAKWVSPLSLDLSYMKSQLCRSKEFQSYQQMKMSTSSYFNHDKASRVSLIMLCFQWSSCTYEIRLVLDTVGISGAHYHLCTIFMALGLLFFTVGIFVNLTFSSNTNCFFMVFFCCAKCLTSLFHWYYTEWTERTAINILHLCDKKQTFSTFLALLSLFLVNGATREQLNRECLLSFCSGIAFGIILPWAQAEFE